MNLAPPIRWVQPSREPTAAPEAARPGEWSELPTIERATGELELTARSQAFVGGLASRRPARATHAPLRGGRSLEAPHGLVRGIARALDGGRRDGPELAPAPPVRASRRGAVVAGQSTAADEPSLATERELEAEPASAPTDVGLGPADLPEPPPRVVQAVMGFGGPGAREAPALTRAAEGAPIPPAGRISRAPLAPDRSEAHVTEADASPAVASAPYDTSSAEPSPGLPLSEFLPRRLRGHSAPQPVLVEPEPGPGPEPAATTEPDAEARAVDGEPPGDSGTPEPLQVTSAVTAARSFSARPETSADEASSGLTADVVPPAPPDTSARTASGPAPRPVTATPAPAISRSAARDSGAAPGSEAAVHAAPVEAAAVTSRGGDAAVAAPPEEHVSFEPSPERADPAPPAQPRRPESPAGSGEGRTTRAQQVSRAAAAQRRAPVPRERGAVEVPATGRGMRAAAPVVQRHETPGAAQTYEPTASEAPTATRAVPAKASVDAPVAAPAPEARADSGAHAAPEPSTRRSRPARRAATAAVQREATTPHETTTPHESEAATAHEPVAPEAASAAREPVTRARAAESPPPAHETRAPARPSTAAGVQRQAAVQPHERDETRAHVQPSTAAGVQRRATVQPREPVAPEDRSDTPGTVTRARAVESPPAPEAQPRARAATAAKVQRQATGQPREPAAPETTADTPGTVTRGRAVESPPAPEAQPQARAATAAKVQRQATARPRGRAAPGTATETPDAVVRARAAESPPPARKAQPHAQATTAAKVQRQATAQPRGRAAPETATETPDAVTPARTVAPPPPAQRTQPNAQASTGADVQRQATAQRHEDVAREASTEAREPVVASTVADAPVPASEARTNGTADATSESSTRRLAPARPAATGSDVGRGAKTPPAQPRRQDAVDVPARTRESTVLARSADATAAELTVSPEPEPPVPTRPAPAAEDRDEWPDATQREAPVAARRPGFDLHALLSASSTSRSSAAPAGSIQRVAHARGAEQTEGAARLPGLGVQRTRSAPRSDAATSFPRTVAEQTPRAALQLVPSLMPVAQAAPAAHLPAPAMPVALPAPPDPPATIQRIKSVADPESTARERFSEASDDELEVLADRLYDHIRTRFRSELLIDRERAGLLADRY